MSSSPIFEDGIYHEMRRYWKSGIPFLRDAAYLMLSMLFVSRYILCTERILYLMIRIGHIECAYWMIVLCRSGNELIMVRSLLFKDHRADEITREYIYIFYIQLSCTRKNIWKVLFIYIRMVKTKPRICCHPLRKEKCFSSRLDLLSLN